LGSICAENDFRSRSSSSIVVNVDLEVKEKKGLGTLQYGNGFDQDPIICRWPSPVRLVSHYLCKQKRDLS
jgi:hypothetical protein